MYTRIMKCEGEGGDHGLPANHQKLGENPWNRSSRPSEGTNPDDTLISAFQTPGLWDNKLLKQNKQTKTTGTQGATAEVSFPEYLYKLQSILTSKEKKRLKADKGASPSMALTWSSFLSPHLTPYVDQIPAD